jgi:hypothetical protein
MRALMQASSSLVGVSTSGELSVSRGGFTVHESSKRGHESVMQGDSATCRASRAGTHNAIRTRT